MSDFERIHTKIIRKINRRKKIEIYKQFICNEGNCYKSYGSYAALYTHMKKKHEGKKIPEMKNNYIHHHYHRNARKGRPKQIINQIQSEINIAICRICLLQNCQCVHQFNNTTHNTTIQIMSDQHFIHFTNQLGSLSQEEQFSWVRNTEHDYHYYSENDILQLLVQYNHEFKTDLSLNNKIIKCLSHSSRYWQANYIIQLYWMIFTIKNFIALPKCIEIIFEHQNIFQHMISCLKINKKKFDLFVQSVRNL